MKRTIPLSETAFAEYACPHCGCQTLVDPKMNDTSFPGSPASHTLDDDDPNIFTSSSVHLVCTSCHAGFSTNASRYRSRTRECYEFFGDDPTVRITPDDPYYTIPENIRT